MEQASVAVLGVGELRFGPPVLAALATYFGERPLELVLYEPNEEILDAMHRLARSFFKVTDARHAIVSTSDLDEAIRLANRYIVCDSATLLSPRAEILALPYGDWPPELSPAERAAMPLQILRWIRLEDWPWEPLKFHERAPVKAFLDGHPLVV